MQGRLQGPPQHRGGVGPHPGRRPNHPSPLTGRRTGDRRYHQCVQYDPNFVDNEERYHAIKEEILGEGWSDDSDEEGESGDSDEAGEWEGEMTRLKVTYWA